MNVTAENPRFKCNLCEKSYVHKSSLSAHRSKVHLVGRYKCTICDKNYFSKGTLNRHKFVTHAVGHVFKQKEKNKKRDAGWDSNAEFSIAEHVARIKFKLEGRAQVDLNFAVLDLLGAIQENCESLYSKWGGLKGSLYTTALLSKPAPILSEKEETIIAHFRSQTFTINEGDFERIGELLQNASLELLTQLDAFSENGSGWLLEQLIEFHLNAAAYNPLWGGRFSTRLPAWILKKKACIDVPNSGEECFLYAVLVCLLHSEHENLSRKSLKFFEKYECLVNVSQMTFPVTVREIDRFERMNPRLAVNVISVDTANKQFYPVRVSKQRGGNVCFIDLLLFENHYIPIVNKSRLLSRGISNHDHSRYFCDFCLNSFVSRRGLRLHKELCQNQQPQRTILPPERSKLSFSKIEYTEILDFFICFDFEAILPRLENPDELDANRSWSVFTQRHVPCMFSFCTVDYTGKLFTQPVVYCGKDAAVELLRQLQSEAEKLLCIPAVPMSPLSPEEQQRFDDAKCCEKCCVPFSAKILKCRDHSHSTGKYRYCLCVKCNFKLKNSRKITCLCHNLSGYDQFYLIEAISEISNPKFDKIKIIPKTLEKYRSFTYNKLRFVDSFSFMSASLDKVVRTLGPDNFGIFEQHFTDPELRKLLRNSKLAFCYEYMTSFEKLREQRLPAKSYWHSTLCDENISDQQYEECQNIFRYSNCRCIQDYLELYVKCDVLLLACCVQNFRKVNYDNYGIDCLYFISAPSFYYQACLKMSGVELDLITDPTQYLMIENGIRGGLSQVFRRQSLPNNPALKHYNPEKPKSWAVLLDQNSLYAAAQFHFKMPVGDFRWLTRQEIETLDIVNLSLYDNVGYIFYLDLLYPRQIKELTKNLPLCPTTTKINFDMLSSYQKEWLREAGMRYPGVSKLIATQLDKPNITLHLAPLQTYLKLGMTIDQIHCVLSFTQSFWLRDWVQFNIEQRKKSKSKFEQDTHKLAINSTFGSFLLSKRKQRKVTLVSSVQQLRRLVTSPLFTNANVINNRLCAVEHRPKSVILDRPYILGFTILEHAKTIFYEFYYNTLLETFGNRMELNYCDTDSYFLTIFSDDIYKEFEKISNFLDTSNYDPSHPLYSLKNKGRLLCVKDEFGGKPLSEAIFIKSKCYSIVTDDACIKKLKGVNKRTVLKRLTFDDYKLCLFENKKIFATQMQITNKDFVLYTAKSNRLAISSFDDKSFYVDALTLQPHGYEPPIYK